MATAQSTARRRSTARRHTFAAVSLALMVLMLIAIARFFSASLDLHDLVPVLCMLFAAVVSAKRAINGYVHLRDDPWWCRRCDYDLHGNTSAACPECGNPISDKQRKRMATLEQAEPS